MLDKMSSLEIGPAPLTLQAVKTIANGEARVVLSEDPAWRRRINAGVDHIATHLRSGRTVYGVSTGVGDSCETPVAEELAAQMQQNLVRLHGCGTGRFLSETESAAVVTVRLASLGQGWSAVREVVLQRLADLLNRRLLPRIPAEGSVGASGDLTPLSYVAATLVGERDVYYKRSVVSASVALAAEGLTPLALHPKEALALMNGTSVMTALGCLALDQAIRLSRLAASLTAMASDVTRGNPGHFDDRLFVAKPFPGQGACARWIREDIGFVPGQTRTGRVQDRYSIRCAPHVIGVLLDAFPFFKQTLETELNSANDNPLVDAETGDVLHGGNFYGGHVGFAMDALKTAVASIADLLDRQLALICTPSMNGGLPANLVARRGADSVAHHGFKAMQITASALTAEALKLTMPATSFSRSTECHNQDKVSMGTIAARDALRVIELTETVASIHLLALCQAVDVRGGEGCHARSLALREAVRTQISSNTADRAMDGDIQWTLTALRENTLPIGTIDWP